MSFLQATLSAPRALFPMPRRRVRQRAAWPLVAFLVLFGGACLVLEWRRVVLFSNPKAFLLLLAAPWIWWLHLAGFSGLSAARAAVSLWVRLTLLGLLVAALAEPRIVRQHEALSLVYALDLSDSMGEKVSDQSLAYVLQTAGGKPEKDDAGLVVFGRDAAVELPPRPSFPFEAINTRVARDGTDLARGLSLAAAMIPEENQGRIVLVSDGVQTEGDARATIDELRARRIAVDVLPVQYEFRQEVWLEQLDLPSVVKLGETYEATILLSALQAGRGRLVLRENGQVIAEQVLEYGPGKNRYALPLHLREPGYYEYAATIEPAAGQDGWSENNTAINFLYLKGEGKVLVVVDPQGDPRDAEALVRALQAARRLVEIRTAYELPRDALSLLPYDCVIFVNAPADAFDAVQLTSLRDAVFNQGIGFLMVGGKNSFGPGGYHRTAVEESLPVTMDISQKKVLPKGALVIVLHTCEFAEGNVWAKRIAKEAIRVLGAQDEVGLLIYDGQDKWVFPLTPASEYERLVTLINQCQPSDMPSFATIMRMGLTGLEASDAALKHMIMITDGDPSPPPPELVNQFVADRVSVSTVVINPHGGQDLSIMQALAGATGGRYYLVEDPLLLPSIFVKEAKTLKRSMIQNKVFVPTVEFPSPVLKGIESLPELRAYVLTSPKPRSTTILKGPETEEVDPVLATWRYGLGKTAAFTSDLAPNWAAAWVQWPQFEAFVRQLIVDIARVERPSELSLQTMASGGEGLILVEDHHLPETMLELQAQINGPHQRVESVPLKQVGPRRYQGRFPLWGKGRYQVIVAGVGGGRTEQALSGFVVAYSPEYLRFRSNPILLREIVERTGGRVLTGQEDGKALFAIPRVAREQSRPAFDWLLMLLAVLVPLDVGVRRVQLDWTLIRGWLGLGRKAESTVTLGALLKRKEQVRQTIVSAEERRPAARPSAPSTTRPAVPPADTPPAAEGEPAGEPQSTTERLLAKKKQRQQEKNKEDSERRKS